MDEDILKHVLSNHSKNRINPPVTVEMKKRALKQMMIEKENMEILKQPYLTREESWGHSKVLGKQQKKFAEILLRQRRKMLPHCYYEVEIRKALETTKGWGNFK